MPLELFFDLVFVLALTQCTALMVNNPTWEGLGQGLLVLVLLWWTWAGYAWLTSVVDPEEGAVRLAIIAAMAAMLVAALCVPKVFESSAGLFAAAYAGVRAGLRRPSSGRSRWSSTRALPWCSAPTAGASPPPTSPSDTG